MAELIYECWADDGKQKMYFRVTTTDKPEIFESLDRHPIKGKLRFIATELLREELEYHRNGGGGGFPDPEKEIPIESGLKSNAVFPVISISPPNRDYLPPVITQGRHRLAAALRLGISHIPLLVTGDEDEGPILQKLLELPTVAPDSVRLKSLLD